MQLVYTNGVFKYNFSAFVDYSLRARAPGYEDLVYVAKLSNLPMDINITPSSGDASTLFHISTSAENATLYLDDGAIANPFNGNLPEGNHTLRAIKEGYFDGVLTLIIGKSLSATESAPLKKGAHGTEYRLSHTFFLRIFVL
jgi:hypothetical protein